MSRIADALQKAEQENAASHTRRTSVHTPELTPRSISDVNVPWPLQGEPSSHTPPTSQPLETEESEHQKSPPSPVVHMPVAARRLDRISAPSSRDDVQPLVRALFLQGQEYSTRRVLFTSVDESTEAADVVIQVAEGLARESREAVYLVDLDLNHPSFQTRFDVEGKPGFAEALIEGSALNAHAYQTETADNVWIVPAGLAAARERVEFGDTVTHRQIAALIDIPGYVIACAAAIGAHSDAALIGSLFHGVVLVLQSGVTTGDATRRAAAAVKTSKSRLLGTILNRRVHTDPSQTPAR